MNKYIRSVLKDNKFECNLSFVFENEEEADMQAVIDTGCQHSHISYDLIYICFDDNIRKQTKEYYMRNRQRCIGRGVESQNQSINTDTDDVNNERVQIAQRMYDVKIGGISIGNRHMFVSYDTRMVALLGMAFFRDWDMHIGKNKQGETVLLACPNNQLNQDYYLALEKEFGISQKLNAAIVRSVQNRQKS